MPNKHYVNEARHENAILKRYEKNGYQTMRAAGSKSSVYGLDGFAWNDKQGIFIFSRHRKWSKQDIDRALSILVMFPNTVAVFFELLPDGEHTYIYPWGSF